MKTIFFSLAMTLVSYGASASPTYTLNQICSAYGSNVKYCGSLPFCEAIIIPARTPGCHAKPDSSYAESICASLDSSLCNPDVTACYMSNVIRPAQTACRASRDQL